MQKRYFLSSIVALSLLGEFWLNASESVKLEGVEINSVGDNVSDSGIDEGFLTKNIQHGILAGKKAINTPYQINTISKEIMNNQGATAMKRQ